MQESFYPENIGEKLKENFQKLQTYEILCLSLYLFCGANITELTRRIYGNSYSKANYQRTIDAVSYCLKRLNIEIKMNSQLRQVFMGDYSHFQELVEGL